MALHQRHLVGMVRAVAQADTRAAQWVAKDRSVVSDDVVQEVLCVCPKGPSASQNAERIARAMNQAGARGGTAMDCDSARMQRFAAAIAELRRRDDEEACQMAATLEGDANHPTLVDPVKAFEDKVDAALITAAPDMLKVIEWFVSEHENVDGADIPTHIYKEAKAALAKARGGAKVNGDPFMTDIRSGPNAFSSVPLFNQNVWRSQPERAREAMLDAVASGGFDGDCIRRKVGNYEGQIMAIRAGWVDGKPYDWRIRPEEADVIDVWHLNDVGAEALRAAGRPVPTFFTARDDWHSRGGRESVFEYGVYEIERDGQPMLRLFAKAYPRYSVGMDPLLRRDDVRALRDYLSDWLERHP